MENKQESLKPEGSHQDVRREDLNQKDADGKDATRTGSTGGDFQSSEWKPGDEERLVTENPKAGNLKDTHTNAGNGGEFRN